MTSKILMVCGFRLYQHFVQVTPRYYQAIQLFHAELIAHYVQEHT